MNHASHFSFENDGAPKRPATLVIDARIIVNPPAPTKKARRKAILRAPYAKELLYRAERHLEENPDGHVAFGCRLGQDRSPALAEELNRRMAVKAHGEAVAALLALWTKESA